MWIMCSIISRAQLRGMQESFLHIVSHFLVTRGGRLIVVALLAASNISVAVAPPVLAGPIQPQGSQPAQRCGSEDGEGRGQPPGVCPIVIQSQENAMTPAAFWKIVEDAYA